MRPRQAAFTLVEMITVVAIILVLAGLIVGISSYALKKGALSRATGELQALASACENYKSDYGSYPEDGSGSSSQLSDTVTLCPLIDGDPNSEKYHKACLVLYKALSGDAGPGADPSDIHDHDAKPDGKPETKSYFEFRSSQLQKTPSGDVRYIKDPFGLPYGYSTNAAAAERAYRKKVTVNPLQSRRKSGGYNINYDLWSTAGTISSKSGDALSEERARWVRNW